MHEILSSLPAGARVLDLAAQHGSFEPAEYGVRTIRVDLEPSPGGSKADPIQADAANLPFTEGCFDAVICNHGIEHFAALERSLREIARVLRPGGWVFLSAPDAGTLTDRVYRFLASGGGHVNPFRSAGEVTRLVSSVTGLECAAERTLYSSLSFLHPANRGPQHNRRYSVLLGAGERTLRWGVWLLRHVDRALGTRLSIYGWSFYFGSVDAPIDVTPWPNVCVRCGAAHPLDRLEVKPTFPSSYRCPRCDTLNYVSRQPPLDNG